MVATAEAAGFLFQLGFMVVFGIICALIAHSRGRSAVGWFFIGAFTNCIGIILVLVLPDVAAEERKRVELVTENRRLRELVRKDRQVADVRHADMARRLDTHDRALGLDTAQRDALLPDVSPPSLATTSPFGSLDWYYVLDGEAKGPVRFEELRELRREGTVRPRSLLWHDGLAEWTPLDEIPDLGRELRG